MQRMTLTLFDLSLLHCQVNIFASAQPCLSESHTLKFESVKKLKPWLKKELLTAENSVSGRLRDFHKGSMLLCMCTAL